MKNKFFVLFSLSLASAGVSQAASYSYSCTPDANNNTGLDSKLAVVIEGNKITVTDANASLIATGIQNVKYHRQAHKLQYQGLDELAGADEYSIAAVITETMASGAATGSMTLTARGEGFSEGTFSCIKN